MNNSAYFFLHRSPTLIALRVAMGGKKVFPRMCVRVCVYFIHSLGRKKLSGVHMKIFR